MATEILRPIYAEDWTGSSISLYPSSTNQDAIHMLINEVIADDNSTYVEVTNSMGGLVACFNSELLRKHYNNITSCRLVCRIKGDPSVNIPRLSFVGTQDGDSTVSNLQQKTFTHSSTDWETIYIDYNPSAIISILETNLSSSLSDLSIYPLQVVCSVSSVSSSGSKNTFSLSYTQVYMEITYSDSDDVTTQTILLKENGSWVTIPCIIYQRQNGTWSQSSTDIFINGQLYTLKQL